MCISSENKPILLITGGTGSVGRAVLERYLDQELFSEIRIFSRDEKKQEDMRRQYASKQLSFYLGDVRDCLAVEDACKGVNYIFHAAALKQVPSCESFPMEAFKTNVLGTENVLRAAEKSRVRKVVLLSTDKAAYPVSAMGMSKAMMEKLALAAVSRRDIPEICITRFCNVLESRGSVLPWFLEQIATGRPLTVTHPDIARFFISLEQAVDLVDFAFREGKSGEVLLHQAFVIRIQDMALVLNEIFGIQRVPEIIGLRPGEKVKEHLCTQEEWARAEPQGDFVRIPRVSDRSLLSGVSDTFIPEPLSREEVKRKLLGLKSVQTLLQQKKAGV